VLGGIQRIDGEWSALFRFPPVPPNLEMILVLDDVWVVKLTEHTELVHQGIRRLAHVIWKSDLHGELFSVLFPPDLENLDSDDVSGSGDGGVTMMVMIMMVIPMRTERVWRGTAATSLERNRLGRYPPTCPNPPRPSSCSST
jgi:hypothetical protein